jgi:hypothetical protein
MSALTAACRAKLVKVPLLGSDKLARQLSTLGKGLRC